MTLTASKYARVLWEVQMPMEALREAAELVHTEPKLMQALADPEIYIEEKYAVIDRLFPEQTRNFIKLLCRQSEIHELDGITEAYQQYLDAHRKVLKATIYYVTPPDEKQLAGIETFLKRQYQAEQVELRQVQNRDLIGGFVLEAEGQEYDWSLRGRLNNLTNELSRR